MSVRFKHLPIDLLSHTATCIACGHWFPIPFLEERPMSLKPVFPLDYHPITNNVRWTLIFIQVDCPCCKGWVTIEIPTVNANGRQLMLYGDEAMRKDVNREVFTYSLVGADSEVIPEVNDKISSLKRKWARHLLPTDWRMHMTEAWSGDGRLNHKAYASWNKSQVDSYVEDVLSLLDELQNTLFIFNVSAASSTGHVHLRL